MGFQLGDWGEGQDEGQDSQSKNWAGAMVTAGSRDGVRVRAWSEAMAGEGGLWLGARVEG